MQALQSKADALRSLAATFGPNARVQSPSERPSADGAGGVTATHDAVLRLRAFVAIGHQLSQDYVKSLGTQSGGPPRPLASHVVRVEVLLGSVIATRRAFECGGVDLEAELEDLVVRATGHWSVRNAAFRLPEIRVV